MGRLLTIGLLLTCLPLGASQETQPGRVFLASPQGRQRALGLLNCKGEHHLVLGLEGDSSVPAAAVLLDLKGKRARTDPELIQRVHGACCIELHQGHMSGWWRALFPRKKRTALGGALHQSWRRGTPVLGSGAGASMLGNGGPASEGDWPLKASDRKENFARGRALTGLGISPLPLLGSSGLLEEPAHSGPDQKPTEGTPAQVLAAMERYGVEAGAWLEGSVALVWTGQERTMMVHGPGRLHFLVLDGAHRKAHVLGLLWELGDGSTWLPGREEIRVPKGDSALTGVDEVRTLGQHKLLIRSLPASRQHQRAGHLPTRTVLQVELTRRSGRGHDRRR